MTLYHGTRRPFGAGGLVLPGNDVGVDNHGLGRSDTVYVTPDLGLAKQYAKAARGEGVPRVLSVRPWTALERDDSTIGGEEQRSFRTSAATVLAVVWRAKA